VFTVIYEPISMYIYCVMKRNTKAVSSFSETDYKSRFWHFMWNGIQKPFHVFPKRITDAVSCIVYV